MVQEDDEDSMHAIVSPDDENQNNISIVARNIRDQIRNSIV